MPKYRVRLESTELFKDDGSPHFRETRLAADDAEAARALCERNEYAIAAWSVPADELAELEAIEADPEQALKGLPKARLYTHRQQKPYEVVLVEEVFA